LNGTIARILAVRTQVAFGVNDNRRVRASSSAPSAARGRFAAGAALALAVFAWTWPITWKLIGDGDFPEHLAVAESIVAHPSVPAPHVLFFGSVAALMTAWPGLTAQSAGVIVISLLHVATALLVFWYLRRESPLHPLAVGVVAAALLAVGPILPPGWTPTQYLVGYFPPNPFHNATFTTAKPFCLWLLLVAAAALRGDTARRLVPGAAAAVFFTAISKPNYLTCVVPALVAGAVWLHRTGRRVNWAVVAAVTLPAVVLVLLMQRLYGDNGVAVVVAPLAALSYHVPIGIGLVWQLLGALAFPLAVAIAWPRLLRTRIDLQLAWAAAGVAFAEGYLLGEAGTHMDHGNLLVAASQSVFVLMVASAAALVSLPAASGAGDLARRAAVWLALAFHLAGGLQHLGTKMELQDWSVQATRIALAAAFVAAVVALWPRQDPARVQSSFS
jgi:hypothetical protein